MLFLTSLNLVNLLENESKILPNIFHRHFFPGVKIYYENSDHQSQSNTCWVPAMCQALCWGLWGDPEIHSSNSQRAESTSVRSLIRNTRVRGWPLRTLQRDTEEQESNPGWGRCYLDSHTVAGLSMAFPRKESGATRLNKKNWVENGCSQAAQGVLAADHSHWPERKLGIGRRQDSPGGRTRVLCIKDMLSPVLWKVHCVRYFGVLLQPVR